MNWPFVDVVVPVHAEEFLVGPKIANLKALEYPRERIAFWIVDGASKDQTAGNANRAIAGDPRFILLQAGVADKTAQLNLVLPQCRGAWILVTDADARLPPDTLERLVAEGESDSRVGAVGATVHPLGAHPWERLHWQVADRVRLSEGARGSASIVTAPCYLLRRGLVPSLPEDVAADDVHVAFRASAAGWRVSFIAADVAELRSPATLAEMLRHKHRKAAAYLRELIRFFPRRNRARSLPKAALRRHAARTLREFLGRRENPAPIPARIGLAAVLGAALLSAAATLPFARPRARFPKIDSRRARVPTS